MASYQRSNIHGRIHRYLEGSEIKHLEQIERKIDYDAIERYAVRLEDMGMPRKQIFDTITAALDAGARRGGVGMFYNAGKGKRAARYIAQRIGGLRGKTNLYGNETRMAAMRTIESNEGLPQDMRDLAKDVTSLEAKREAIYALREANLISDYKARALEGKLQKRVKRDTKTLTDILSAEVGAILLFVAGAFLLGLSFGKPSVLGYAVFNNNVSNVANTSLFGLAIFVIGAVSFFYLRRRR